VWLNILRKIFGKQAENVLLHQEGGRIGPVDDKKKLGDSNAMRESTLALALVIPGLPSCYDTILARKGADSSSTCVNGSILHRIGSFAFLSCEAEGSYSVFQQDKKKCLENSRQKKTRGLKRDA
jgi:hypothetical protein